MLDSDQILEPDTVHRCIRTSAEFDMICLEERSFRTDTVVEKLFDADRIFINRTYETQIDPRKGAMLPRFFKREVLSQALSAIPTVLRQYVVAHDHAIIYHEASKVSGRVGFLRNAVRHIEPRHYPELWRKNFEYGRTSKLLADSGYYSDLLHAKVRFRPGYSADVRLRLASYLLSSLKGVPYWLGYLSG
jgi:hypothetical protein